jgi:5-methylcytosine-specific restriction endonuclease McrA
LTTKLTNKDRNAIKGAIRRVFARSELRNKVLDAAIVKHSDPTRPRVKTWCLCKKCKKPEAKSYCVVDHIRPVVPVDSSFAEMTLEDLKDRLWCDIKLLQVLCPLCHDVKTKAENQARREHKKRRSK